MRSNQSSAQCSLSLLEPSLLLYPEAALPFWCHIGSWQSCMITLCRGSFPHRSVNLNHRIIEWFGLERTFKGHLFWMSSLLHKAIQFVLMVIILCITQWEFYSTSKHLWDLLQPLCVVSCLCWISRFPRAFKTFVTGLWIKILHNISQSLVKFHCCFLLTQIYYFLHI